MIIVVDKSEQDTSPSTIENLKHTFPNLLIANLPHRQHGNTKVTAGDINIPLDDGNVLAIERKTVSDLLGSIPNRHVMNQIEVMHSHAKFVALIITGKLRYSVTDMVMDDKRTTEWNGRDVRSLLRKIQLSPAIVEFCPEHEYANMVMEIYKTVTNIDNLPKTYKNRIVTFPPVDERVQFLAQLPSVSLVRAMSLLNFAGMMEGVKPDEDGNTFGTVAQALHYMSILSHFDKDTRPEGWGSQTILTNRKFIGLASDTYFSEIKELPAAQGGIEIDGRRYEEIPF